MSNPELKKFENLHKGETCYIIASGPTLKEFNEVENGIYIACNNTINEPIIEKNVKYYFFGHHYMDYANPSANPNSLSMKQKDRVHKLGNSVQKFGIVYDKKGKIIFDFTPDVIKNFPQINAIPCRLNHTSINKDLHNSPFLNYSIAYPCFQFALYAGFSKIYLVGCDCAGETGSVKNLMLDKYEKNLVNWWMRLKEFRNKHYPNVEIININPIVLKNKFDRDIFI